MVSSPFEHEVLLSFGRVCVRKSRGKGWFGIKEEGGNGEEREAIPTPVLLGFSPSCLLWALADISLEACQPPPTVQGWARGVARTSLSFLFPDPLELPPLGESLMDLHPGQAKVRPQERGVMGGPLYPTEQVVLGPSSSPDETLRNHPSHPFSLAGSSMLNS